MTERYSYDRGDFRWDQSSDGIWCLHVEGRRETVLRAVPDVAWPKMWRIAYPDGRRSDMVNLTRAKDAAITVAVRFLGQVPDTLETLSGSPPMRESQMAATLAAG